jgi:pimeloyl-ACP methyl ester carboxylesterase
MSLPQSNVSDYNAFAAQEGIVLFADRVRSQFPLGDKPVVILSRKAGAQEPLGGASPEEAMARRREKERIEGTKAFTLLSRNSLLVVAEKSGHEIHLDQPDLVIEAIKAVMEAAKNGSKLRSVGSEGL